MISSCTNSIFQNFQYDLEKNKASSRRNYFLNIRKIMSKILESNDKVHNYIYIYIRAQKSLNIDLIRL